MKATALINQLEKKASKYDLDLNEVYRIEIDSSVEPKCDTIEDYMKYIKSLGGSNIFYTILVVNESIIKKNIELNSDTLDVELQQDLNSLLSWFNNHKNSVVCYTAVSSCKGITFKFNQFEDLAEDFFAKSDQIDELLKETNSDSIIPSVSNFQYYKRKELLRPFAEKLSNETGYRRSLIDNDYFDLFYSKHVEEEANEAYVNTFGQEHEEIMRHIIKDDIKSIARENYKVNVEPIIREQILKKVSEWKKAKMPKVEMAARLEISASQLNFYFYKV